MSYNQKPTGPGGTGGGPPPNGPQNKALVAGIQQQMQNLVGQNALNQAPAADLNAFIQQQHIHSMFKQQMLLQHQMQQQQHQQQQNKAGSSGSVAGGGGGGEPLALTRTPGAAELLSKTYQQQQQHPQQHQQPSQQQSNGGGSSGNPSTSNTGNTGGGAAPPPSFNQLQQNALNFPTNIMQQLQAFQYIQQQHQQQQQQQHHHQPQQQQHGQSSLSGLSGQALGGINKQTQQQQQLQGQAEETQKALQQFTQRYFSSGGVGAGVTPPGGQKVGGVGGAGVSSISPAPSLTSTNQLKPPNLPPSTQITPVSSTNSSSTGVGSASVSAVSGCGGGNKPIQPSISLLPSSNKPTGGVSQTTSAPPSANQTQMKGTAVTCGTASAVSTISSTTTRLDTSVNKVSSTTISKASGGNPLPLQKPLSPTAWKTTSSPVGQKTPTKTSTPSSPIKSASPVNAGKTTSLAGGTTPGKTGLGGAELSKSTKEAIKSTDKKPEDLGKEAKDSDKDPAAAITTTPPKNECPKEKVEATTTTTPVTASSAQESKTSEVNKEVQGDAIGPTDIGDKKPVELSSETNKVNKPKVEEEVEEKKPLLPPVKIVEAKKDESVSKVDEQPKANAAEKQKKNSTSEVVKKDAVDVTAITPAPEKKGNNEAGDAKEATAGNSKKTPEQAKISHEINEAKIKEDSKSNDSEENVKGSPASVKKAKAIAVESTVEAAASPVKKSSRQAKTAAAVNMAAAAAPDKNAADKPPKRRVATLKPAPTKRTASPTSKQDSDTSENVRKAKRHRLKTSFYQSPLPELAYITKLSASEASNSPKPSTSTEDKLITFYKNEYLAVRNAEETFYLCQTMQNVYRTSPRISIRWLSEDKKDNSLYEPVFYDHTDIECILTNVNLERVDKGHLRLPAKEKERIERLLKKSIDVEKGLVPKPELSEENPDGLDISLFTDEAQIEKKPSPVARKSRRSGGGNDSGASNTANASKSSASTSSTNNSKSAKKSKRSSSGSATATSSRSAKRKSPGKKRKSLTMRKKRPGASTEDEEESTDESDTDYKPSRKKSASAAPKTAPATALVKPVQRNPRPAPTAKAANSPQPSTSAAAGGGSQAKTKQKLNSDSSVSATPVSSRGERATKRKAAGATDSLGETPIKKAALEANTSTNTSVANAKAANAAKKRQESANATSTENTEKLLKERENAETKSTATPSGTQIAGATPLKKSISEATTASNTSSMMEGINEATGTPRASTTSTATASASNIDKTTTAAASMDNGSQPVSKESVNAASAGSGGGDASTAASNNRPSRTRK